MEKAARSAFISSALAITQEVARESGVGCLRHHIFLCRGPRCCSKEQGETVWKYLKERLKALGLAGRGKPVYRTKVDCLRICQNGPNVLVYPEGIWYHQVDEQKMERILQNHCIQGKPIKNEAFAINPLPIHH